MSEKIRFAIVGAGWRAEFFFRIVQALPEMFEVTGVVVRNPEKAEAVRRQWGLPTFSAIDPMLSETDPQFVLTSVSSKVNAAVAAELAEREVPILSETPPGLDLEELIGVHRLTEQGARIQVAEQYCFQPLHVARLAFVQKGYLGRVSQAQISVAHGYHGTSLMRRFLGIMYEPAQITATEFTSPLVNGPGRDGPPVEENTHDSLQQFFQFDFGDRLGVFDFTGDQYFSWVRSNRLLIRGDRGEIVDRRAAYLKDFLTPIELDFVRHSAGAAGNLEGKYLKGIQAGDEWLYRNPFIPASLTDDEIAIATCLTGMSRYVETGEEIYPLAEACQDQYLSLMAQQALETGTAVQTQSQPWAQ